MSSFGDIQKCRRSATCDKLSSDNFVAPHKSLLYTMCVGSMVGDEIRRRTMWPWTIEENEYLTKFFKVEDTKRTSEAFAHKMRTITMDVTDMQVDLASKMFGLVNKHTDNLFGIYENVFNKQVTDYRNVVRSVCKE